VPQQTPWRESSDPLELEAAALCHFVAADAAGRLPLYPSMTSTWHSTEDTHCDEVTVIAPQFHVSLESAQVRSKHALQVSAALYLFVSDVDSVCCKEQCFS